MCGVGGCVGNGQATCGHDGRQVCGRSGDSDGLGGYGRLGCGWRVCGRVRPPRALVRQGAGGLRENCRTLVSYAFGRPKFFCKRRVLPCGNSCGMCVSLKKKYARPAYGRPAARAARKTLAAATRKKIRARPAGGIVAAWRGKRRLKKNTPLPKKNTAFYEKKTPAI